jgi:hypothetical protein
LIPATGKVGANLTNTTTPPGVFCGTDGSNPLSSSEESANHRFRCVAIDARARVVEGKGRAGALATGRLNWTEPT